MQKKWCLLVAALTSLAVNAVVSPTFAQPVPTTQSNEQLTQPELVTSTYPLGSDADRAKTTKICQQLTVDLLATFNDYKESHWNLSGPLYLVLHEYFQAQADYYRAEADIFAERALQLGYSVDGRYSTIARTTRLPDMPAGFISDNESIHLMMDRVSVVQKEVYEDIKALNDSDPVTANKLQDFGYAVDKNLWQLRIHVAHPGGEGAMLPWANTQTRNTGEPPAVAPNSGNPKPSGG